MRVLLPEGMKTAADPILEILKNYKTIAVVGLSSNQRGRATE
jgi:predicted CoA-binding protein